MNAQPSGDSPAVILVVVNDDPLRAKLRSELDLLGYTSIEAPSAESAVKYLKESTPDLIVMDVDLPGVSGIQACQKLRSTSRLAQTPVLLLVEQEDIDVINQAFDAGATDCIVKSSTPGVVSIRVRYAMRNSHKALDLTRKQEQLNQAQQVAKLGYWRLDVVTQNLTLSDFALPDRKSVV